MKKILLDASSAILLFKVNLLERLFQLYTVSMAQSVYEELTENDHYGSEAIRHLNTAGRFRVVATENRLSPHQKGWLSFCSLDPGELDTIKCFAAGKHDFIIIDDGKGAKFCERNLIPFINALLFQRLLYWHGDISQDACNFYQDSLIQTGRYSEKVIEWARKSIKESLDFAIPCNSR